MKVTIISFANKNADSLREIKNHRFPLEEKDGRVILDEKSFSLWLTNIIFSMNRIDDLKIDNKNLILEAKTFIQGNLFGTIYSYILNKITETSIKPFFFDFSEMEKNCVNITIPKFYSQEKLDSSELDFQTNPLHIFVKIERQ